MSGAPVASAVGAPLDMDTIRTLLSRALQHPAAHCIKASHEGFLVRHRGRMRCLDVPTKKGDHSTIVLEVSIVFSTVFPFDVASVPGGTCIRNRTGSSKSVVQPQVKVTGVVDYVSLRKRIICVGDSVRTPGISFHGAAWVKLMGHRFFKRITEMYR